MRDWFEAGNVAERISVKQALRRGFWTVNMPVLLIMVGVWIVAFGALDLLQRFGNVLPQSVVDIASPMLVILAFSSPFIAWIHWSIAIPKWKLWAYSRVDDLGALKRAAVRSQLIWPDGHLFEKTELCPKAMRQKIRHLEGRP